MPFEDVGTEEWRPVVGWEGLYEVSSQGRLRSLPREKIGKKGKRYFHPPVLLRPATTKDGYLRAALCCKPERPQQSFAVHRLVAEAFVPRDDGPAEATVNHIDGSKTNNHPSNLEWVTRAQNSQHGWRSGLMTPTSAGERHPNAKLTNDQAAEALSADLSGKGATLALARRLGVSVSTINLIRRGRRYAL